MISKFNLSDLQSENCNLNFVYFCIIYFFLVLKICKIRQNLINFYSNFICWETIKITCIPLVSKIQLS